MPETEYYTAYPRPILWLVPGGEVAVGTDDPDREPDAAPAFRADVEPFYLSKLPVTNEQFEAFDPGHERSPVSPGDRDPAVGVSWYDAAEYCSWYAEVARKPIRLPTEIEWEHACRGGEAGRCRASDELAWHRGNSGGGVRVPSLEAKGTNGFGFHALLGGVWEWTGSVYRPYPLAGEEPTRDGEPDDAPRVLRGGSFREHLQEIACSARRAEPPDTRFDHAGFRIARSFRTLAFAFLLLWSAATATADEEPPAGVAPPDHPAQAVKIYADRPGVYAVDLEEVRRVAGLAAVPPAASLRLRHGDRAVPFHVETGEPGTPPRLELVADRETFRPDDPRDARPLRVFWLEWGRDSSEARAAPPVATDTGPAEIDRRPRAVATRRLAFERDVVRAPITAGDLDEVDTLWYWTTLSQLSSARLEVEIGGLADRAGGVGTVGGVDGADGGSLGLEITVDLLGWSRTATPDGVPTHQVDLTLNGTPIGRATWDGRRSARLRAEDVDPSLLWSDSNHLVLEVPERRIGGEPLVDLVYVDRVEVSYRAGSPLAGRDAPLTLDGSDASRWLPDPDGSDGDRLVSAAGWSAPRRPEGGWVVPPTAGTEVWAVAEPDRLAPVAIERPAAGARATPPDTEYLVVTTSDLAAGAERLADLHRRLGRHVATVDVAAVYDEYGDGERGPRPIRRFLDDLYERSGTLRWVVLVGDADWFEPDDLSPGFDPTGRDRIPSWTFIGMFGPAASDHFFASDPEDEAAARFAVGRIPVADPAALEAYVSKEIAWVHSKGGWPGRPSMLMLSDSSKGSRLQRRRQVERLDDAPLDVVTLDAKAEGPLDGAAIEAIDRGPAIVYFGGHGSRYMWELGDPGSPEAASFFDREDVARLAPTDRPPIALSLSCATAPFDHPNADSLGEVMTLNADRGAVAFVGASSPLFTPPRFGEALVRGLLEEESLGEAFVAAKRRVGRAQVSHLYVLLGDPGLPLDRR